MDTVPEPALPGAWRPKGAASTWCRARVTLSWPLGNCGPSLPNLLATVAGNLFELQQLSGLRLVDLRLPPAFAEAYPGPRFGIEGTRRLAGVHGRPLIGTIIKPSVGLTPEDTAALTRTLCEAGIDFIKDDELQADGPGCPFEDRARAVLPVIAEHAQRTGKKVMYALNITGELDQMRRRHELVLALGGTCVMASLNAVGLAGMIELGRFAQVPIHAHRNGWGALSRHPALGWSYIAWQKDLAPGRGRPHARQWARQQIRRGRRQRDRLSACLPLTAVRRQALPGDAGILVRTVGPAGAWHVRGAGLDRSDLRGGRWYNGPS